MQTASRTPHKATPDTPRVCPACEGTGHDWAYTNNPSDKPFRVTCTACNGEGALEMGVS